MTTRKRLACSQICAGMYLVRILDSWWKSPFFRHRRLLSSHDVQELLQSGIQEVEIDTAKGLDVSPDAEPLPVEATRECHLETEMLPDQDDSFRQEFTSSSSGGKNRLEDEPQEQIIRLRGDTIAALEGMFEGVKTGLVIPHADMQEAAKALVEKALAHPTVVAEIMLIGHLEQFDPTLYSHVVDTALLAILVGLQLKWEVRQLEEIAVAALLHDVGYMRLPLNLVQTRWGAMGADYSLLQQHVDISVALINKKSQFSQEIAHIVHEHHAYLDGSGYSTVLGAKPVSDSGTLLGLTDYVDELLAVGNSSGTFPVSLAIRRVYQEAQKGKFPTRFVEAMIRVLGVYPVGTVVQLSTGEDAVVVKQNPEMSVRPQVKIIRTCTGEILKEPEVRNLATHSALKYEVRITKVLDSADPSINLREIFS
ncbi:HD domain-containing phosphohydrolase [uncultured Nitrospira sp.]|uniref:HD-GYP domain-containing protein n=1 Tax=uncultured Nitrospira sp. TaxID=157176 RepID=UPI003140BC05